jgi:hypothetical protein
MPFIVDSLLFKLLDYFEYVLYSSRCRIKCCMILNDVVCRLAMYLVTHVKTVMKKQLNVAFFIQI